MGWSNTAHITQADWDEHQNRMNLRRLQDRIYKLKRKIPADESDFKVETVYIGKDEDVIDVLQAMLETEKDEDDKP